MATRVQELEQRFREIGARLPEGDEREAIQILHGLIQETRRELTESRFAGAGSEWAAAWSLDQVRELHLSAPPMEGPATAPGLRSGA